MDNKMFEKLNLNPFFNYKNYEVKYKVILQEIFSRRKHLFGYTNDEILLEVMNFCNNVDSLEYLDIDADILGFYMPSEEKVAGKIVVNKRKIEKLQIDKPFESVAMCIFDSLASSLSHAILDDRRTGEFGLYSSNNFDKIEVLDELINKAFAYLVTNEKSNLNTDNASPKILALVDIIAASLGFTRIEFLKLASLKRKKFEDAIAEKIGNKETALDIINCFSLNLTLLYSAISSDLKNSNLDNKTSRKNILNAIASVYSVAVIAMNTRIKDSVVPEDINSYIIKLKKEFATINKLSFDLMDAFNLTVDEKEIVYMSLNEYLNSLNIKIAALSFISDNLHVMTQDDIELSILAIRDSNILTKMNEISKNYDLSFSYEDFNYKKYIDYIIDNESFDFDNSDMIEYIDNAFDLEKIRQITQLKNIEEVNKEENEDVVKVHEADENFEEDFSQIDQIIDRMFESKEDNMGDTKVVETIKEENLESENETNENENDVESNEDEFLQTAISRNKDELPYEDDLDKGILDCLKPKGNNLFKLEQIVDNRYNDEIYNKENEQQEDIKQEESTLHETNNEYENEISNYDTIVDEEEPLEDEEYKYEDEDQISFFDLFRTNLKKISLKLKVLFERKNNNLLPPSKEEDKMLYEKIAQEFENVYIPENDDMSDTENADETVEKEYEENPDTNGITKRVRKGRR